MEERERMNGNGSSSSNSDSNDENESDMEEVIIAKPTADRKGKGEATFPGEGSTLSGASTPSAKGKGKARSGRGSPSSYASSAVREPIALNQRATDSSDT